MRGWKLDARCGGLRAALWAGVSLIALPATGIAHAQEIETVSATQDDNVIIVTARRKEESLQDVPVTITTIGGETLRTFEVTNVDKLLSRIPSLSVQQGGPNGGASLSLRGVGTANLSPAFESAVLLDFDGVLIGQLRILQAGFFDTEQIDVLKGPQSLFFGKSASAGVLSLRSANPTDNWEVGGRVGYEFEEKGYITEGYISGPISDTLGVRLAARYNDIEELVINDFPGASRRERGASDLYVRGTLNWNPQDRFNANLKLNYIKSERDGASLFADIDCGANGVADPVIVLGLSLPAGYDCNVGDGRYNFVDPAPQLIANLPPELTNAQEPFHETEIMLGRLQMDLDISDRVSLTSVTGLYRLRTQELEAFSFGGIFMGGQGGTGIGAPNIATDQFTQELRLSVRDLGPLSLDLGAFYEYRDSDFDAPLFAANIGLIAPDPITGFTADSFHPQNTKSEAISIFASGQLELTPQLVLSGGVRYTDESKVSRKEIVFLHAFLAGGGAFLPTGFNTGPIRFDDDNISPEVVLRYEFTPEISLFAAYKTGFKAGGIESAALPTASLAVARDNQDFSAIIFDSEESEGGEIGIKSLLFNNSLRLNITAYRYEFSDLQVQFFDPVGIQFITQNASQVRTMGVDVDFQWSAPLDGLSFSGALAYLDAGYTRSFVTPFAPDDLIGRAPRNAPEFAGNVAFDYFVPIGGLELGLTGNAAYSGSYFVAEESLTDPRQPDFVTFDAAISIGVPDERWKLTLSAINVTDKLFQVSDTGRPFLPPTGDDRVVSFNRGRQAFATLAFKF